VAVGFKVADAYVDVHVEDGTKVGRDKIGRDTDRWANQQGEKTGNSFMRAMARGILSGMRAVLAAVMKVAVLAGLVGVVGAAIAGLAGYLVQAYAAAANLVMVLGQAAGAFLLLPGIIFTVIGAISTLKLAFSGMGAALKAGLSGDMAAFNEALSKMAPNAQAVAREIVAMKPAFEQLKRAVQTAVFAGMGDTIRQLGEIYLPLLERGLSRVGDGLNKILMGISRALLDPFTSRNIEASLGSIGTVLGNLGQGLQPLLTALSQVLSVSSGVLAAMSNSWIPTMQAWADTIRAIPEDEMAAMIENGIRALKMLAGLLIDIGGILSGLARAAGQSSVFDFFDRLHDWVDSAEGQQLLTQFFTALRTAADALSPALLELGRVFVSLLTALSRTMEIIGPTLTTLIGVLGEGLLTLIPVLNPLLVQLGQVLIVAIPPLAQLIAILLEIATAMGPGLMDVLNALAVGLEPLRDIAPDVGRALGEMLSALAPLLIAIGPVLAVLLEDLAILLSVISVALAPVIELVGELVNVFATTILQEFLNTGGLEQIIDFVRELTAGLRPLIPLARRMFEDGLSMLLDVFERNRPAIEQLMPQVVEALLKLGEAGMKLMEALAPLLPVLGMAIIKFVEGLLPALIDLIPAFFPLIDAFVELVNVVTEKRAGGLSLMDMLVMFIAFLIQISVNSGMLSFMLNATLLPAINAMTAGFVLLTEGVDNTLDFLEDVAGVARRITDAVVGFKDLLFNAGADLIKGLLRGIGSMADTLWTEVKNLGSRIVGTFNGVLKINSPSLVFAQSGVDSVRGYIMGAKSQKPQLDAALGSVAASLPALLENAMGSQRMTLLAAMAAMPAQSTPVIYAKVQIGERPVREMVKAEMQDHPEDVSDAADEGHRQSAFVNPGRKRVGVA
jgi:phage-related protein